MSSNGSPVRSGARVLVVDDEDSIRQLVSILLRGIAQVDQAATGEEAMRSLTENVPDLILLDARLPDMAGADVARIIRDRPQTAATPIVMVSGEADQPALGSGIDGFLRKPFDLEELRECVRRYLAR